MLFLFSNKSPFYFTLFASPFPVNSNSGNISRSSRIIQILFYWYIACLKKKPKPFNFNWMSHNFSNTLLHEHFCTQANCRHNFHTFLTDFLFFWHSILNLIENHGFLYFSYATLIANRKLCCFHCCSLHIDRESMQSILSIVNMFAFVKN